MTPLRALLDRSERVVLMGVLNCTPDSFSDGGLFGDEGAAVSRAAALVAAGAAVIDVGAESTRPGSTAVPAREQIARLGGVVRKIIAATGALVSIDTTLPEVAEYALAEGAVIVNTVSLDPAAELGVIASRAGAALVLMHSRGAMSAMKGFSVYADDAYRDVVSDVGREWSEAAGRALAAGLPRESLVLDPGLGFAKNAKQSIAICARLGELCALGFPVLVGPSRKSFLARVAAPDGPLAPPDERLGGTIAAVLACVANGASIARVHDVAAVAQALAVDEAIHLHGGPRGRDRDLGLDRGRRHA
jgi:dihydropteroate synthase